MEDGVEAIEDLVKNSEDMSADQETEEQIQQGSSDREEEEGKKSSGVVKSLISALVSRGREGEEVEGKSEDGRASDPADEASGGGGDGGGGGIINSFISNIFHQSEAGDGERESNGNGESDAENGGEDEQVKDAEGGGGGGGSISVLDNIVSHLPKPLSDSMAPEEASILIHSIVHD
ncbi:PREDICTED: chromo domain-containing protein LHP1-like [Ipomoea nil]|uniref:chromo domain-containing protein LHP1-like n=1 Tax=Ipomoea nil TaxID=35883 RepID=UPI0009013C56|nr:PREDICTED: chromo domain-containing protein LHP1-like [Ipomoea nil]